ncbi:Replication stress response regulator SDE2 [Nymphon striatum]|nr:Replication stress response regulator SDE2 [Nymphon striatum]
MAINVKSFLSGKLCSWISSNKSVHDMREEVSALENIPMDCFYMTCNGKLIHDQMLHDGSTVNVTLKLYGGKGGFGSMLRAIGAQIEKTTNREACRDLSGRRLRDINEEKRLKKWIAEKDKRAEEAVQKKQERLERLQAEPKHLFHDPDYEKQRSELEENMRDAVEQGLKNEELRKKSELKRKSEVVNKNAKKKKTNLWIGVDISDESLSESDEDESSTSKQVATAEK